MALLDDHRRNMENLNLLVTQDTMAALDLVKDAPVPEMAFKLRENLPVIADEYAAVAEELAITYYDAARAEAGVASEYKAARTAVDVAETVQGGIGYAIANVTKGSPWEAVIGTLTGTMQRATRQAERATISYNIVTDPDGTLYERVPSALACAFCLTMAAVAEFRTEDYFQKYHDNCHCTSRPVFTGQDATELPIYGEVREAFGNSRAALQAKRSEVYPAWEAEWKASGGRMGKNLTRDFLKAYPELSLTTENILSGVRQSTGWR
jgi:hypothetical protein